MLSLSISLAEGAPEATTSPSEASTTEGSGSPQEGEASNGREVQRCLFGVRCSLWLGAGRGWGQRWVHSFSKYLLSAYGCSRHNLNKTYFLPRGILGGSKDATQCDKGPWGGTVGSQDSRGPARCGLGEGKGQTLRTGRMPPGDWLDGGQEAEEENQSLQECRCAGIQPIGNCRRIHGDVPLGGGARGF